MTITLNVYWLGLRIVDVCVTEDDDDDDDDDGTVECKGEYEDETTSDSRMRWHHVRASVCEVLAIVFTIVLKSSTVRYSTGLVETLLAWPTLQGCKTCRKIDQFYSNIIK